MRQDLQFALRTLGKNPGFAAVVVLSIALGIAANTTVFSIVNGLLLGEIPVREPDRVVAFGGGRTLSWPDYLDYRDGTKDAFEDLSAFLPITPASVGGRGEPERVWGQLVTGNYFNVLEVDFTLGRGFLPEEDEAPGRSPVVVLSHGLWTRRFGADPGIVGKEIRLNGYPYRVVGVTRPGYTGAVRAVISEFWAPIAMMPQLAPDLTRDNLAEKRNAQCVIVNGRLKPGVSREQAQAGVHVVQRRIDSEFRKDQNRPPLQITRAGELMGGLGNAVLNVTAVLAVVVGLVLLIACANVANILLARATARQKEIGVRLAVGASRGRLLRQLLTESVLLSCMGAVVGFVMASWAVRLLSSFRPPFPIPIVLDFTPDTRVYLFTAALAVFTGILFGLAPALRATRPDLVGALKDTSASLGSHRWFGLRNGLVVTQVALSLVLLVGAMLFLRSLRSAASIDIGMQPGGVALLAFDPKLNGYGPEKTRNMLRDLRERVSALPGVTSVTYLDSIPLSIGGTTFGFHADGGKDGQEASADVYNVGLRYFETMGIPLVRGREFDARTDADGGVAILNQTMAAKLFDDADPVGREITANGNTRYRIVGVAKNSKSRTIGEDPAAVAYLYLEAAPEKIMSLYGISIAVKGAGRGGELLHAVREQIRHAHPDMPVFNAATMREHVEKALLLPRLCAALLGIFGATGLLLAMVGLYGVMSYSVRSRTREIGIRMALGAEQRSVLQLVTRQGLAITAAGLTIGIAIAFALSRFLATMLYGVSPTDKFTFLVVPSLLLAVAAVAVFIPARRASQVDPLVALRYE